jgi:mycofactocin biosynthetic radical S-adenosylmethionine protein MftC
MYSKLLQRFPEHTVFRPELFGGLAYCHTSRSLYFLYSPQTDVTKQIFSAPVCLTWEITAACNLHCTHCLSSSGKASSDELTTTEAKELIDEWVTMKVFYLNIGGGEPLLRTDFFELMEYALERGLGIKLSTNGLLLDDHVADWIASTEYFDVQVSIDGATEQTNDRIRGNGSFRGAWRAIHKLLARGFHPKLNMVITRQNVLDVERIYEMACQLECDLRLTRLRPSGRGVQVWHEMRPTHEQNQWLYEWLVEHRDVLTGDSFFHLSAYGQPLPGMNLCGAGRMVCCVDPMGGVYACPFLLLPQQYAGNVRQPGGFTAVWNDSALFSRIRQQVQAGLECQSCPAFSSCHGGCMAVKISLGISPDLPDPDCIFSS